MSRGERRDEKREPMLAAEMTLDLGVVPGGEGRVSAGPLPHPLFVSPQWFNKARGRHRAHARCHPLHPTQTRRTAQAAAPQWGRAGRARGRGARWPAPRTAPRRSVQPQGLGAVLTPTGPERSRRCAAAVPLHRGRPQARSLSNSFPPDTERKGGHPPQCAAGQRQDWFTPLSQDASKVEGVEGMESL